MCQMLLILYYIKMNHIKYYIKMSHNQNMYNFRKLGAQYSSLGLAHEVVRKDHDDNAEVRL